MSQGKKFGEAIKEQAIAKVMSGMTISNVAKEMDLGYSTVRGWVRDLEALPNFAELRELKRQEFINNAWDCVEKAHVLLKRRLKRAIEEEAAFDKLIDMVNSEIALDGTERRAIVNKLSALKFDDAGKLATVIGTMYDKQALASNEPTSIHGGEVALKRFEDM